MSTNLPPSLAASLASLAAAAGATKLVLFGSRARGDHNEHSDIDLAVYGLDWSRAGLLAQELEELPTLLKFDLVHVGPDTSPELIANINRDGVILYAAQS